MLAWRILWKAEALFLVLLVGCSSIPKVPRVEDIGQGRAVVYLPRTADLQPVKLEQEEFQRALRRLAREARLSGTPRQTVEKMFQMDPQFGNYLWLEKDQKLVPLGPGEPLEGALTKEDLETAERYRLWCQRIHNFYGDCLGGALVAGRYLDMHGRYIWALALSKSPVLDEMKKALGEMVEVHALIQTVLWTLGSMLLILALNPVAPALVAVIGVGLILYVGVDTLLNLASGWLRLMDEVKVATTFEQIREAGERFGRILGREAARAFAMLLMAAIGSTAKLFATKVPALPGSAQVAAQAEGTARLSVSALSAVEEIALSAEGVSVAVAGTAMTMGSRGSGGTSPCIEKHHIATVCNDKDTSRGGPWTPRFRAIFAKAGMSMEDPANKMPLQGHYGPHPQRYHEVVHEILNSATQTCRGVVDCREKLTLALKALAKEISTPGAELNQLVTRRHPR
ncbi:AHH domain-containing protein [Hyalangium rubrum]|uniref:AHH domain-containing protein n=1 Tax=Hyalangium rubrum TaxID=3103134 RepID=A0ABU5HB07_9BACT|nr:AHH domain-containing protein [Hyalangium sp. s54d21]MDY7230501.1 AHH domain-containing protein [Hyalangium sp. s54d21]